MTQTALQPYTGEEAAMEARLTLLHNYNPKEHLITIQAKQGGQKPYYPAAWRLYELSLKYADANFKSEIAFMDLERDIVIVKAYLFLGPDYDLSPKKAEAFKQGKLSQLDKVETAAKARAARDFGISTELALDMEDADTDAPPTTDQDGKTVNATLVRSTVADQPAPQNGTNGHTPPPPTPTMASLREKAKGLGLDERKFRAGVCKVLGVTAFPKEFSSGDLWKISNELDETAKRTAGGGR